MRSQHRLDVTLTLLGPILTRGGMMSEPGIDAPLAYDRFKRPMLPFSLIKGKIRDAFRDLIPAGDPRVVDWLGAEGVGTRFDGERGRLRFSDFVTEEPGRTKDNVIERIEIDSKTGSTAGRMLAMLEAPFGYGQPVVFKGTVEFIADGAEANAIKAALEEAFRWVPAYGALRTVGFGRTHSATADLVACPTRSRCAATGVTSIPMRLRFDRPLCLVGRKHSGNHFESLQTVSGAVLKGAVARLILAMSGLPGALIDSSATNALWPSLCEHFEEIRFTEARPMSATATRRPIEPPLSIVTCPTRKGEYFDVALNPGPMLIGNAAPAFVHDWKGDDFGLVRGAFGWPDLPTERRTRTAIDNDTGRAKDQSLFSYGLVLPEHKKDDGTIDEFVWETSIGLEAVDANDRPKVIAELVDLLTHGLPGVGKTRAVADVEWLSAASPPRVAEVPLAGAEHVVTLQTEFLMTDPDKLMGGQPAGLENAYRDFWEKASGGAFELERYFAKQALHGGFLWKRSRQTRSYQPFLVTERGSAFVLKTVDAAKAAVALLAWREQGLPVADWVRARFGNGIDPHWRTCPFLPHVGFGEVTIDLACHSESQP